MPPRLDRRGHGTRGALHQVRPPGPVLTFQINPESVVRRGGVGGWRIYDRPRRAAALEWGGQPVEEIAFTLTFDGWEQEVSVEAELELLEAMGRPVAPGEPPPELRLAYGPIGTGDETWVLTELDYGDELRNAALERIRADVGVTLVRYEKAGVTLRPVDRHKKRQRDRAEEVGGPVPQADRVVVVVSSDEDLARIAARELGDASRWPEIAELNDLRDPRWIQAGANLMLPAPGPPAPGVTVDVGEI